MNVFNEIDSKLKKLEKSKDDDTIMSVRLLKKRAEWLKKNGKEDAAKDFLDAFRS